MIIRSDICEHLEMFNGEWDSSVVCVCVLGGEGVHANFNCAISIHRDYRTRPDERVSSIYLNPSIAGSTICQHTF